MSVPSVCGTLFFNPWIWGLVFCKESKYFLLIESKQPGKQAIHSGRGCPDYLTIQTDQILVEGHRLLFLPSLSEDSLPPSCLGIRYTVECERAVESSSWSVNFNQELWLERSLCKHELKSCTCWAFVFHSEPPPGRDRSSRPTLTALSFSVTLVYSRMGNSYCKGKA